MLFNPSEDRLAPRQSIHHSSYSSGNPIRTEPQAPSGTAIVLGSVFTSLDSRPCRFTAVAAKDLMRIRFPP